MLTLTQNDIEKELSDAVPHGLRKAVARLTQTYESVVYAWLNADDERKSPAFQQLAIQAALDEIDPEIGEAYWQRFCALREASRPHEFKAAANVDHELGSLSKEISDVVVAKCEGKPISVQLREIAEAERQLGKYKDAVLDQVGRAQERVN